MPYTLSAYVESLLWNIESEHQQSSTRKAPGMSSLIFKPKIDYFSAEPFSQKVAFALKRTENIGRIVDQPAFLVADDSGAVSVSCLLMASILGSLSVRSLGSIQSLDLSLCDIFGNRL